MKHNLLFLDTETTGIADGRLIQLAYKKEGSQEIFMEFFKPPVPIEIEAMAVHHITEKKVAGKPSFPTSPACKDLSRLLDGSILVAHNAKFDIGILRNEGVTTNGFICTQKVAQTMYDLPRYKMQYLRYLWSIDDMAAAHDAEGDVIILEKVFEHMVRDYMTDHGVSRDEAIDAFLAISEHSILLRKMNFGKYAGKTFDEIKTIDPSYLDWMAGTLKDKDEDLIYTLHYHMRKPTSAQAPGGGLL